MFVILIHLKNPTFLNLKIIVDTDWCQEWNIKTLLLKITENKHVTISLATTARKYSSPQLTANCVAAIRCLLYYVELIWKSPATENTR